MGGCAGSCVDVICQDCGVWNEEEGEWYCPQCVWVLLEGLGPMPYERILGMETDDRFNIYRYLGLDPTEKREGGVFLHWKVGASQFNESKPKSKVAILKAIDAKKQKEIFASVQQQLAAFAGLSIVVSGSTMRLTITDYNIALNSALHPLVRQLTVVANCFCFLCFIPFS
jgi:hypothetical protein